MFITFEGIDGSGKSTQLRLLADNLRAAGLDVVCTREPGGSQGAEEIRALLLRGDVDKWSPETELLLFTAARRDHVEKCILPNLEAGKIVLCDRYLDSTRAYQGAGSRERLSLVNRLHEMMIGTLPDVTLLFEIEPKRALERSLARLSQDNSGEDRFEKAGLSFQESLNAVFQEIVQEEPERMRRICADGTAEDISARVLEVILQELTLRGKMHSAILEI